MLVICQTSAYLTPSTGLSSYNYKSLGGYIGTKSYCFPNISIITYYLSLSSEDIKINQPSSSVLINPLIPRRKPFMANDLQKN